MPLPKSVTKIRTKHGQSTIEFTESVDRVNYTMEELCRAALKDVKKYILKMARNEISANFETRTGTLRKNLQGWVPSKKKSESEWGQPAGLAIGFKNVAWYGMYEEFGSTKQPKLGILQHAVEDNIAEIIKIESQYLSALEDEAKALGRIDESEDAPNED